MCYIWQSLLHRAHVWVLNETGEANEKLVVLAKEGTYISQVVSLMQ